MRRGMLTVAAAVLVAGAAPVTALAHHGHHKHHARHHARIRRFGDQSTQPTSTSPSDNAGKVVDFSNGVLTIQLNDGSTVKGAVTNDTEIECTSAQSQSTTQGEDDGSGDQSSGDNSQSSGSEDQGEDQNQSQSQTQGGDQSQSQTQSDGGDQSQTQTQSDGGDQSQTQTQTQGEDQAQSSGCSSSSLSSDPVVHDATLQIGGSGNTWQKVEIVS